MRECAVALLEVLPVYSEPGQEPPLKPACSQVTAGSWVAPLEVRLELWVAVWRPKLNAITVVRWVEQLMTDAPSKVIILEAHGQRRLAGER